MSGDAQASVPPPVIWTQRSQNILLTICLEDCKKPEIKISADNIYFKGTGGTEKKEYEVNINLYNEINPELSSYFIRDRIIELILKKKQAGPFWPQLTKEKVKHHWLRVDFNRWEDEDSDSDAVEAESIDDIVRKISQVNKAGGDSELNYDGLNDSDSDDGDFIPELD